MKKHVRILCLLLILPLIICCSGSGAGSDPDPDPNPNDDPPKYDSHFTKVGNYMVCYVDKKEILDAYTKRDSSYDSPFSGSGSVSVEVIKVSGNDTTRYAAIRYLHKTIIWNRQIEFGIRPESQTFNVMTVDRADNDISAGDDIGWIYSSAIKKGLNDVNVLTIDYNTVTRHFEYKINNVLVHRNDYRYISEGYIEYFAEVGKDTSATYPYQFKFRTISPYQYP